MEVYMIWWSKEIKISSPIVFQTFQALCTSQKMVPLVGAENLGEKPIKTEFFTQIIIHYLGLA